MSLNNITVPKKYFKQSEKQVNIPVKLRSLSWGAVVTKSNKNNISPDAETSKQSPSVPEACICEARQKWMTVTPRGGEYPDPQRKTASCSTICSVDLIPSVCAIVLALVISQWSAAVVFMYTLMGLTVKPVFWSTRTHSSLESGKLAEKGLSSCDVGILCWNSSY